MLESTIWIESLSNVTFGIKFKRNVILATLDNWNILQTILSGMF